MAKARSITFNINTTADFAQLEGLQRAINGVSDAVDSLAQNMKTFNNSMNSIQRNYNKAADSVDKVRTATTKFTANLNTAAKAETKYEAITRRRVALNRELQQQTNSLTQARTKLTQAEKNLDKANKGGNADDIQASLNAYKDARKEFDLAAESAKKTGNAVNKLTEEQKQLATEVNQTKSSAKGFYDGMSKEAQAASGPLKGLITTFGNIQNKIKGTMGTVTRMTEQVQKNNKVMTAPMTRGDSIVKESERQLSVLKQSAQAYDQLQKEISETQVQAQKLTAAEEKAYAKDWEAAQKINAAIDKRIQKERELAQTVDTAQGRANREVETERLQHLQNVMTSVQNKAKAMASAVVNAFKSFAGGASSAFSNFGGMLMKAQSGISKFSSSVSRAMQSAQRAMTNFYNSGWSFITSGYIFQNFGQQLFRTLTAGINDYLEYEKTAIRASVAASIPQDEGIGKIQDVVFGLQRGNVGGGPMNLSQALPMDANEIAQGLYYYISAIGLNLEEAGTTAMQSFGKSAQAILQVASMTQTDVQTMTKGVLNAVMEFGIDPRFEGKTDKQIADIGDFMSNTAAQFGYLANLTTMEVPDIAEAFKMVGPLAHALTGDAAGAGLNDTMALLATASDVGLRGGQVGRGVNQLLQSILSPTKPALEAFGEAFGKDASKEAWNAFFFDSEGKLKDGIPGLFESLSQLNEHQIADMFTNNAARVVTGVREAAEASGKTIREYMDELGGNMASDWRKNAQAMQMQSISANLQILKNAIFQFKTAIIDSVEEPLKRIFSNVSVVLFKLADVVAANPWIGKVLAGVIAVVAAVSTLIGTLFMAAGSIMLMLKAFATLGSMMGPLVLLFSAFTAGLLIILPILAAIAGAVIYLRNQWQDADSVFHTTVAAWGEIIRDRFQGAVESIPETFAHVGGIVNAVINEMGNRFVQWVMENKAAFAALRDAAISFAHGFADAFVVVMAEFATFSVMMGRLSIGWGQDLLNAIRDIIAHFTGLQKESISLAKILGGVLGGAIGLLVARHFIPSIAITLAFRGALLALRIALLAGAAASFVVAAAFKAIQVAITVVGALVSAFGAVYGAVRAAQAAADASAAVATSGYSAAQAVANVITGTAVGIIDLLVVAVLALVVAYVALVAVLAAVLIASVAYIAATQGLAAGLNAAWQAVTGVAAGFWLVVEPIVKAAAAIIILVGKLFEFVGVANNVHTIGMALGVMLGLLVVAVAALTAAFAALGLVVVAAVIAAFAGLAGMIAVILAPVAALVGTIYLLGEAFQALTGIDPWSVIGDGLGYVADMAVWAYNKIKQLAGALVDLFTESKTESLDLEIDIQRQSIDKAISDATTKASGDYQDLFNQAIGGAFTGKFANLESWFQSDTAKGGVHAGQSREDWITENAGFWQDYLKNQQIANDGTQEQINMLNELTKKRDELANPPTNLDDYNVAQGSGSDRPTRASTKGSGGAWNQIKSLMARYGFDPTDPAGSLTKLMGLGTFDNFTADIQDLDMSAFSGDPKMAQYKKDMDAWVQFQSNIENRAKTMATNAGKNWDALTSGSQKKYLDDATKYITEYYQRNRTAIPVYPTLEPDDAESAGEEWGKALQEGIAKGAENLPMAITAQFGSQSAAAGILQYSDTIMKNLGDNAPWMNQTELLMDAAISGNIGKSLAGKNMQKELEPYLRVTSEQTGIAISDMIKDIPKFVASDSLKNVAVADMVSWVDTIPEEIAKRLDTLGTDVKDRFGNFVAENGFNWDELATFAASKGTDQNWNLTDYIMEAWDMTRADAEAYIKSHSLDPNIISGATFGDVRMMANMADGAVSVVDEGMYAWAQALDEDGKHVLEVTQATFDAIPLAMRIGLTNAGYTFVLSGNEVADDITATNKMLSDRIKNTYDVMTKGGHEDTGKTVDSFWSNLAKDIGRDNVLNDTLHTIERFTDDYGQAMVKVTDLATGQTVTMPAIEYDAWAQSTADIRKKAGELQDALTTLQDRLDHLKGGNYSAEWFYDMAVKYNISLQGVGVGGLEALDVVQKNPNAGNIRGQERLEAAQGTAAGGLQELIQKKIDSLLGDGTSVSVEKTVPVDVKVNIDDTITVEAASTFTIRFNEEVNKNLGTLPIDGTQLTSQFTAIGASAAAAFNLGFGNAIAVDTLYKQGGSQSSDGQIYGDAGTTQQAGVARTQNVTTNLSLDTSLFDAAMSAVIASLDNLTRMTYMTHLMLDHANADTELTTLQTNLQTFADTTYNATVGIDTVALYSELYAVEAALDAYDVRPASNATVGIVDFASGALTNIINQLDSIDNRTVTTTITTQHNDLFTTGKNAAGGVINENLSLVGERGPEIAAFPQGTRIQSSARTMNMLRGALQPDDNNVQLASIFRDVARETSGGDTVQNSGNTTVIIQNVNISNDRDGKQFFEQMDQWQGRRNQLANRGMVPVTGESGM